MRVSMLLLFAAPLMAGSLETFTDNAMNTTQRNSACFALRGNKAPETIAAMRAALENPGLQACAAANLGAAGAYAELAAAVRGGKDPSARAAAARELGNAQRAEFLGVLGEAARDRDVLVSSNAIEGLMRYEDRSSVGELRAIAVAGGMQTALALDILIDWRDAEVAGIGRRLMASKNPADQLVGIRAVGVAGDGSDLQRLRELAKNDVEMNAGSRGFGFMPAVSISRAAKTSIENIESRESSR